MNQKTVGNKILELRKRKKVTQEELASHLGVSKAAVSKWESGRSFPDILLLPVLASYFDCSIDVLLDYEPLLSKEQIRELFCILREEFMASGYEVTSKKCKQYIKRYFSCYELLLNIGNLLLNHVKFTRNQEQMEEEIRYIITIFERIEMECSDLATVRQAIHSKATALMMLNEAQKAIETLEPLLELPLATEVILASAYQMNGENQKALELSQQAVYKNLVEIIAATPLLLYLYKGEEEKLDLWYKATKQLISAYDYEQLHPFTILNIHANAAYAYMKLKKYNEAYECLEEYVRIVDNPEFFPPELKQTKMFNKIDLFIDSLALGKESPISEKMFIKSVKDSIVNNPLWDEIKNQERFKQLSERLCKVLEKVEQK